MSTRAEFSACSHAMQLRPIADVHILLTAVGLMSLAARSCTVMALCAIDVKDASMLYSLSD